MALLSRRPAAPAVPRYAVAASPEQPFTTAEQAGKRLGELNQARRKATECIIELEQHKAVPVRLPDRKSREARQRALSLLASDQEIAAVMAMADDAGERLAALLRLRTDIDEALAIGGTIANGLANEEFGKRFGACKDEYVQAMRRVALAVIELERAQAERDRVIRDVLKAPKGWALEGASWKLLGRIRDRACEAYRFLCVAQKQGWISAKELADELKAAQ